MTGRLRGASTSTPVITPEVADGLASLLDTREHVDVVIPRTSIRGKMRLLGRRELSEARAAARNTLAARGIEINLHELAIPNVMDEFNNEQAVQTLAIAVRDPANPSLPLDTVEEWSECDDDQIAALYDEYKSLAARLDPLEGGELTKQEWATIDAAVKKKDVGLLISYGSQKLALYATTSVDPPAT